MSNIQNKWKNVQAVNEERKAKLIAGIIQFKAAYKDKIAFNPKAFKTYKWLVKEISKAEFDFEDKDSLLNQVVNEAITEYNLRFSVAVFRWHNLYSETSQGMDGDIIHRLVDKY
jgi:hypothetical protein